MSRALPLIALPVDSGLKKRVFELCALLLAASKRVMVWRERSRSRAMLARLNERDIRDLGLTRTDAWAEINKPFWRP
jgi:uncharacterized protein YjiS (DUF1127 family)